MEVDSMNIVDLNNNKQQKVFHQFKKSILFLDNTIKIKKLIYLKFFKSRLNKNNFNILSKENLYFFLNLIIFYHFYYIYFIFNLKKFISTPFLNKIINKK